MPKAKKTPTVPTEDFTPKKPLDHESDRHGYHKAMYDRLGAGACDVCGQNVAIND